ncbi:exodeoxyribonuclease V subunit alpha [Buchnera aphidicola]|uniref:exodeoxyribonuclease V subunit alpha n=1 Tax=Buchnera aphidicola TaxID=9 RepID=UPI00346428E5
MIKLLQIAVKKSLIRLFDLEFGYLISQKKNNLTMLVSACLSYASYMGNSCLPISIFEKKNFFPKKEIILIKKILNKINNIKNWKQELLKDKNISHEKYDTPLIIYKNKIYLNKIWKIEKKIVNFIKKNNIQSKYFLKYTNEIKNILFQITENQQKKAIALAMIKKITFIIGGPGTGKTTIIKKILDIIINLDKNILNIKIAAYTGKATCRINETLKKNINYRNIKAITLHNLIGIKYNSKHNYFNTNNKILVDILIIDETSMIDLFTMNKLIDALPNYTEIIFLGDINQLSSIENGSILKDICYYAKNTYTEKTKNLLEKITDCKIKINNNFITNITDCIYILKKTYRFKKNNYIKKLSNSILKNDNNIINKIINGKFYNINYYNINTDKKYKNMIQYIILMYSKYLNKLNTEYSKEKIIQLFNKYQVLCAIHNGAFSTNEINQNIENNIIIKYKIKKYWINNDFWYHGRPIMIQKNNKYLNLFNGDIGITMYNQKNQLEFFFLHKKNKLKKIPIYLLDQKEYEIPWSITIHKSQGSEFKNIIIILPKIFKDILNKELIYTAITRSKKKITIFSDKNILKKTLKNENIRFSGIKDLIRDK